MSINDNLKGNNNTNNSNNKNNMSPIKIDNNNNIITNNNNNNKRNNKRNKKNGNRNKIKTNTTATTTTTIINSNNIQLTAPPPPPPPLPLPKLVVQQQQQQHIKSNKEEPTELTKSIISPNDSIKSLLESFQRNSLSKTKTKVRTADGRVYEEQLSPSGHSIEYKGLDESNSIKIYKEKTNLTSFNYCKKFKQWIPYSHINNIILPTTTTTTTNITTPANSVTSATSTTHTNEELIFEDKILTFLTFNVWFDSFLWKQRATRLFQTIESKKPDVLCLQEVTPTFLDYLKDLIWVKDEYCISDNGDLDTVYPYGVVILFKYSTMVLKQMTLCPLPDTNQSRKMISSIFSINNNSNNNTSTTTSLTSSSSNTTTAPSTSTTPNSNNNNILISISTVHLESLDINSEPRIKQFNMVSDFIDKNNIAFGTNPVKHHFIMGDFNFSSDSRENFEIGKRSFSDLWDELNNNTSSNCKGFTYVKKPKRVDRVIFKSLDMFDSISSVQLIPLSLSLIGYDPVEVDVKTREAENIPLDEHIYPSDHFGLLSTFKFTQSKKSNTETSTTNSDSSVPTSQTS